MLIKKHVDNDLDPETSEALDVIRNNTAWLEHSKSQNEQFGAVV